MHEKGKNDILLLKREADLDPKVPKALRCEFELRNRTRSILAEKQGEKNSQKLKEIAATITLKKML